MATLTSANSRFVLTAVGLFSFEVHGYATDDMFTQDNVTGAETMMGADGRKSAGWVPTMPPFNFVLQADSDSIDKMAAIISYQETTREVVRLDAVITIPGIAKSFTLSNGTLKTYAKMPTAKKVLQPRSFGVDWESINPAQV